MRRTFTTYEEAHQAAKDRMVELFDQDQASADLDVARRQTAEGAGVDTWDLLVAACRQQYCGPVVGDPDASQLELLQCLQTDVQHHSAGTLFDHLHGTRELLAEWGNGTDVCAAGLFHSIYGTEYYRVQSESLTNRSRLADVIGERAESLAFLFCVTDRDEFTAAVRATSPTLRNRLDDTTIPIDTDAARALLEIEVANIVEQVHPRFASHVARVRVRRLTEDAEGLASPSAVRCLATLARRLDQDSY